MIDGIVDELMACDPLNQSDIDWLMSRGVPILRLARNADGAHSPIRAAEIVELPSGEFEFARDTTDEPSARALVIPAHDRCGDMVDLVAWNRKFLGSWLGRCAVLGEEQLVGFRMHDAVEVYRSPLDWLAAGRVGTVVVDWNRAGPILRDHPLRAVDLDHGRHLAKACAVPPPRISVPLARRAA